MNSYALCYYMFTIKEVMRTETKQCETLSGPQFTPSTGQFHLLTRGEGGEETSVSGTPANRG